ncbi:type II secretion system minor pseudopilin GspI [Salinibius halmophilus]|uniref:type II secretion system minor pseudopilin GspI n=1 Tax=Salinibius halmophilus TaxID=1853216 RepID=UPI000E66EDC7|nr:type II secretion system minor pseudopilin GspI [Salinibius halmophilus]
MNAKQRGFTLFEVLIALVVFAMVAGTMSLAIEGATNSAMGLEQRVYARWAAEDTMAKIRLGQIPAESATSELPFAGYTFQVVVTSYDAISATYADVLKRVRVDVQMPDNPDFNLHSLVGLVVK